MEKTNTVTEQGQPMAEGKKLANGNGDGGRYLGIINSGAIALLIAIMAGFWSLADPRGEIKAIRDNYLSLREHNVFAERVQQDIARTEKALAEINLNSTTQREWNAYKIEHGARSALMQKSVDNGVTKTELDSFISRQQIIVDSLRREIDQIDKVINSRISAPQPQSITGQIGIAPMGPK